jgi:hypothetical protein
MVNPNNVLFLILIDKIEADRERRLHAEEQRAEEQRSVTRRSRFDQQVPSQQKIPSLFDSIQQSPVGATPGLGLPAPDPPCPQQQHFPPAQPTPKKAEIDFVPKAPYYELPAGMIVPLVKLEDFTVSLELEIGTRIINKQILISFCGGRHFQTSFHSISSTSR